MTLYVGKREVPPEVVREWEARKRRLRIVLGEVLASRGDRAIKGSLTFGFHRQPHIEFRFTFSFRFEEFVILLKNPSRNHFIES